MSKEKPSQDQAVDTKVEMPSLAKRRRFIHGAGVAVPILMTMAPRSALAKQCLSPSAQASINLTHSREDRPQFLCSGGSPGFWKNAPTTHLSDWTASGAASVTSFGSVFSNPLNLASMSFLQVLQNGNGSVPDDKELGSHLVAAWCNLMRGWVPEEVLSLATLKEMSAKAYTAKGYSPMPGVSWYAEEIVAFIKNNTFDH